MASVAPPTLGCLHQTVTSQPLPQRSETFVLKLDTNQDGVLAPTQPKFPSDTQKAGEGGGSAPL